jgi:hypothetical protein
MEGGGKARRGLTLLHELGPEYRSPRDENPEMHLKNTHRDEQRNSTSRLGRYTRDVRRVALLTAAEEEPLGKRSMLPNVARSRP